MAHAGRIYQNPDHPAEIWINIGWNPPGTQLWMPYQAWLSPYAQSTVSLQAERQIPADAHSDFVGRCLPCMDTLCRCSYISESQYDALMGRLKQEFNDPPVASFYHGLGAMVLCMATAGMCSCPCLYLKKKVDEFNLRLDSAAKAAVNASLHTKAVH